MQPPLFSGVLVMPKYENPAKKKVNFLQDSLCYWYRLFSASHGKTAESRMDSRQNHKNDSKDDHSVHKVGQSLYNADGQRQIHAEAVKQLHQHGGAGGSNSTANNRSDCGTYHSSFQPMERRERLSLRDPAVWDGRSLRNTRPATRPMTSCTGI